MSDEEMRPAVSCHGLGG